MKNIKLWLHSMKPVWLREIAYAIILAGCWNLCQNAAQASYNKVDDFESYATGNVDGQGNWHTVGASANSRVVIDPVGGGSKCLMVNAAWSGCYNTLVSEIPAGSTATIFFRANFPSQYGGDSNVGLSKSSPPSSMNSSDSDLTAGLKYNGWQSPLVEAYNNSSLVGVLNNTGGAWYKFWIVVNTTANTYTVYTNAAGPAAASELAFQGGGSGSALRSFIFGGEGSNGGGDNYVDDIYIDYSGDSHMIDPTLPQVPAVPSGLTISGCNSQAALSWSVSSGATGYVLKRSGTGGAETNYATTTSTAYTDSTVTAGNTYYYVVAATNAVGASPSSAEVSATVSANSAPVVAQQPTNMTVCAGSTASFTSLASGSPTVQWQVSADNGANWSSIGGATATTYTTPVTVASDNGKQFRAQFTSACGSVNSAAAALSVGTAIDITTQPASLAVCGGEAASFSVVATGTAVNCQWQVSVDSGTTWINIGGATATTNSFSTSTEDNGKQYRAVLNNLCGSLNSSAATLTVNSACAGWRLFDNFEAYTAGGTIVGVGGWVSPCGGTASFSVTSVGGSKTLDWNGAWATASKALDQSGSGGVNCLIPANSASATVFFRWQRPSDGCNDWQMGLSRDTTPACYSASSAYDVKLWMNSCAGSWDLMAGSSTTLISGAANSTWYRIWLILNTAGRTYDVYVQGGAYSSQTKVATGVSYSRNTTAALQCFLVSGGGSNSGTHNYIDDIYVKASGQDLTDPTTLPPSPATLTVNKVGANASLTWSSSTGATSYNVKRSIVSGGPYSVIGSTSVTNFTDLGMPVGYQYFYVVSGVNTFGEGPESSQAAVTFVGPPSVVDLTATNILIRSASLGAQVTWTGAETPTVTIYYGLTDGGTDVGNWSGNAPLGAQSGVAWANVSGLTPNTQYYYRAFAQNSVAGTWAPATSSFATLVLSPPTMANQTAANVMATTATLGGQVVSTGNDNPAATLYYGPVDGGTSAGAWGNSIAFGVLGAGTFSQGVSGLTPNTTYYFRVYGQNSGGGSWAPATASFATQVASLPSLTNTLIIARATRATLGGTLLSVGNDNPVVAIYYGATDGGTSPAAWGHSVNLGVQGVGPFAQEVSGLSMLSSYYFRCAASNIAGVAWAPSSTPFMTGSNSVATVANLPATNIKFNSAVLNGSVVDNGNDSPTVLVFFGPNNGGTNPAAWDRSITLPGLRNGAYSQIVWGLAEGITNYFTACAVNSSGTNWASSSLSFSTPLTYPVASGHYNNGLGITPPLGWSSWSARRKDISDSQMRAEADVMAATLRDHGYVYLNMDDGWLIDPGTACDAYGRFAVDTTKFSNGMKALADYIHSKGLKFGIYYYPGMPTSAYDQNTPILGTSYHARDIVVTPLTSGTQNPPLNTYMIDTSKPGAMEYAQSIANMLATWGVDYVKMDWVNVTVNLDTEAAQLSTALLPANSGRPIFVQFSNWLQVQDPYGARIISKANGWRNNPDIEQWYGGPFGLPITDWNHVFGGSGGSQRLAIGQNGNVANLGAPGGWNDADSLEMGWSLANTGLSQNEKDMMYEYWAIATSAMLLGCDMISIDPDDLAKLQNDEIIACNQSPYPASWAHMGNSSWQYFWKPSTDGGSYVMFVNFGGSSGTVSIDFASVLGISGAQNVRNLMTHETLGAMTSLSETLDGHTAMLFKVGGAPPAPPVASFIADMTSGPRPLTVTFTDNSTGAVTNRFWDFGDGFTVNTAVAGLQHAYTSAGTYAVTLIVSGPDGVSTNSKPDYIAVSQAPGSLRAWLTFNNTLADATGNGHTGNFWGNAAYSASVPNATAGTASLQLPDVNSPVTVNNSGDLSMNTGQPFTLAAWFRVTNSASWPTIVMKQPASGWSCETNNRATFQINPNGQLQYGVSCVGEAHSSATVNNGQWHHGVIVYDGTNYQMYVDGVADGAGIFAGCNEGAHGELPWVFTVGYIFAGNLDEVGFWNMALTSGQVQQVYTGGVGATLGQMPTAAFSANVTSGPAPLDVTFTDSSTGTITSRSWDFGDGNILNTATTIVPHTFSAAGSYGVKLVVSGLAGASTNIIQNYIVVSPPIVLEPYQAWQLQYFGCTNCPQAAPNADLLGKGINNTNQFLTGLNPTNPASLFRILLVQPQGSDLKVTWQAGAGRTNALQATSSLDASFSDVGSPIALSGSGDTVTNLVDFGATTNSSSRFYRVRLVQ